MSETSMIDRDAPVIERVNNDLLSGRYFALVAASERSRYGYQPPINRAAYAHCIETLSRMAARSDRLAQIAVACIVRVNLYGTNGEERAHVYEAAGVALARGFDDVIGRAGPEAGRHSEHQHEFTLADRVALAYWLDEATSKFQSGVPGVGWCVSRIAASVGYDHR